jgi:hypothetical protein
MVTAYSKGQAHFEFSLIAQVLFLIALFNAREKWLMPDEEKSGCPEFPVELYEA